MIDLEANSRAELVASFPDELNKLLRDILSFAKDFSGTPGTGCGGFLQDEDSINFVVSYFNDPGYRDVASTYPGIPVNAQITEDGLRLTVGVQPYEKGKPLDIPSPDGLPYVVSLIPFNHLPTEIT